MSGRAAKVVSSAETTPAKTCAATGRTSFSELVRGATLSGGNVKADAAETAIHILCILPDVPETASLRDRLSMAAIRPEPKELRQAAEACRRNAVQDLREDAARLDYLAAVGGCRDAARQVAVEAIARTERPGMLDDEALDLAAAAMGWLAIAASPVIREDAPARSRAAAAAERIFDHVMRAWRNRVAEQETPGARRPGAPVRTSPVADIFLAVPDEPPVPAHHPGVVVLRDIGNLRTSEGRRVVTAFGELSEEALPLLPVPDLDATRRALVDRYPHAPRVVDAVLEELVGQDHVRLRPIIVVGQPGCGKTSFARDLLDALAVPHVIYPCGGASDGSVAGNPRRWATGEPSLALSLIARHGTASPGIVLDEIEKVATGDLNGRLHDALLAMLEPVSASRWQDPYIEAPIDISHVVWLGTANLLTGIPAPLRDRCRILAFPTPEGKHLPGLGASMLRRACERRGIDPRWAAPMDGVELEAVEAAWRGGSLRRLERLMDGVLAARDMPFRPN